ncbi:MAG TPA: class I SAM-dependent methyltransferase [Dongiaceae bacterium]|jgi:ubiquinone/menaquinone biosynthesis C-methylase UbiE
MSDPNAYYHGGLGVEMYDLFTGFGLLAGDVEFYLDCAARFGGPVLELGAGTGRVLVPLAAAGHEIVGLDRSPAMLAVAAAKLAENPAAAAQARLVEGDMTEFDLGRRFAQAIIPARAFQHVVAPARQRAALRCIHRHLEPGGRFIVDLFDPKFGLLFGDEPAPPPREARDPRTGRLVRRSIVSRQVDAMAQTVRENLRFEALDERGGVIARQDTSWTVRWSTRQEMAYLLEICGFEPESEFSDFHRAPPACGREQIWIARAV